MRIMIVLSLSAVIASGLAAQQKEVLKVPGAVAGLRSIQRLAPTELNAG